jgi:membrane protease YdiL (CAAX protease family)
LYASILVQLSLFLVLAVLTAWKEGLDVWRAPERLLLPTLATLGLFLLMVAATGPIKRDAVRRREARLYFAMPADRVEMTLWIAVAIMAGVAEELAYRGVFSDLATRLTGSMAVAWTVAVLAFTIAHANQGIKSMGVIALFALVAHVLVYLSGTLMFAIVLHAAYDVSAAFDYVRLGRQLGYPMHGVPDAVTRDAVTVPTAASSP